VQEESFYSLPVELSGLDLVFRLIVVE